MVIKSQEHEETDFQLYYKGQHYDTTEILEISKKDVGKVQFKHVICNEQNYVYSVGI